MVSRANVHPFHGFVRELLVDQIQPGEIITVARPKPRFTC